MRNGNEATNKITIYIMRILLVIVILGFLSIVSTQTVWAYQEKSTYGFQVDYERYIPTIEDDFADNRIIVTLKQQYSDINKKIDMQSFETKHVLTSQSLETMKHMLLVI